MKLIAITLLSLESMNALSYTTPLTTLALSVLTVNTAPASKKAKGKRPFIQFFNY